MLKKYRFSTWARIRVQPHRSVMMKRIARRVESYVRATGLAPEMGMYNTLRILHGFLYVYYYVYHALSFLRNVFFMWWEVNYLKYVFYFVYKTMDFT